MQKKPFNCKNYGSIGHLPNSRLGEGDHCVTEGQARIATEKKRDRHDRIIVQEKLDGSNVGVGRLNNRIIPMSRAGYRAETSPFEQHHLFAKWVHQNYDLFMERVGDVFVTPHVIESDEPIYRSHAPAWECIPGRSSVPYTERRAAGAAYTGSHAGAWEP